jgi:hypothetical protein
MNKNIKYSIFEKDGGQITVLKCDINFNFCMSDRSGFAGVQGLVFKLTAMESTNFKAGNNRFIKIVVSWLSDLAGTLKLYALSRMAVPLVLILALYSSETPAQETPAGSETEHGNLSELGAKLSNPLSDVWALFTEFDFILSSGDRSNNEYVAVGDILFQPLLPLKVSENLKMIVRPTVPVLFGSPVKIDTDQSGITNIDRKSGLGDIALPLIFAPVPKTGQAFSWGIGPTFQFPTHTSQELGTNTWEMGAVLLPMFKKPKYVMGFLAQYWWSISEYGENPQSTSHGKMVYFFYYSLKNAWQLGMNPTVSYNNSASPGNKWNVPVGVTVAKMTKVGKLPTKFQFGVEYAAVNQDSFGPEWRIKLNVIPVIAALQKKPFF